MNQQNLIVCKSNQVIEAGYKLSLNEQRAVLACIGQVNSTEELLKTDVFELSAKDFSKLFNISEDRAYSELQEIAKNLYQRSLTINNPDTTRPKLKKLETRWISSIGYMPDEGKIVLRFAQDILPYLGGLKGTFTKYELKHIGNMNSVYAIRLYELLMQWKGAGKREIAIDWLKTQFQIEEQYAAMKDLKKRVINPAVKDINKYSNFQVAWEQRKTGRKVTHLTFIFSEKQPETAKPKKSYAKKEKTVYGVPMSEINRLARAGETVEQVAARINREREEAQATKKPPKTATKPQTKPKPTETKPETAEAKTAIFESLRAAALGS